MTQSAIDIVIPWVNGEDPEWLAEKQRYPLPSNADGSVIRYRDWGLLRYWFRGIEQFAPWVNKIHFVTWGHVPSWLKEAHPKLNIVRHQDFIPAKYLPTFNVNPIELNMHRIEGLEEQFIFFNDDFYLLRPTKPRDFFKNGLPCDAAILSPVIVTQLQDVGSIALNDMCVINTHFSKKAVINSARGKWFSFRYSRNLLRNLCLLPWRHFPGFFNPHVPQPFLKSVLLKVWDAEPDLLDEVSTHRFREYHRDVNQWLFRYWQLCENLFEPVSITKRKDLDITHPDTCAAIRTQRYQMICINDSVQVDHFEHLKHELDMAFQSILPDKSEFEK